MNKLIYEGTQKYSLVIIETKWILLINKFHLPMLGCLNFGYILAYSTSIKFWVALKTSSSNSSSSIEIIRALGYKMHNWKPCCRELRFALYLFLMGAILPDPVFPIHVWFNLSVTLPFWRGGDGTSTLSTFNVHHGNWDKKFAWNSKIWYKFKQNKLQYKIYSFI